MTYRRNGKLQACEPCRKGKLRCDHMMPHCGRCLKRGKTEKCVYHPAPLTKSAAKRAPASDQTAHSMEDERTSYQPLSGEGRTPVPAAYLTHLEHTTRPTTFLPFPSSVRSTDNSTASTPTPFARSPNRQSTCRLTDLPAPQVTEHSRKPSVDHVVRTDVQAFEDGAAFISHSAVLVENERSIGLSPPESTGRSKLSPTQIERGVAVLALLKDLSSLQKYIDKWFSFAGGVVVIEPMVKIWLDGLRSAWHKTLESSQGADLQEMSTRIWENTSKPLSRLLRRDTTPRKFCVSVTGTDLRWEVIGILVSLVSLVAQSLKGVSFDSLCQYGSLTVQHRWRSCVLFTRCCPC